ncbi:hypothetical protein Tco_0544312, partial [Tanacetum coccineum]
SAFPGNVSPLVAVVALYLGLIKPNSLITINSHLPSSVLQEPSSSHSQHSHLPSLNPSLPSHLDGVILDPHLQVEDCLAD